jgi:hypothetical protein
LSLAQSQGFCEQLGSGSGSSDDFDAGNDEDEDAGAGPQSTIASNTGGSCQGAGGGASPAGLVLGGDDLFFGIDSNDNTTLFSVPATGVSPPQSLTSVQNWGGGSFVVAGEAVYFGACQPDGPCGGVASVPVTGGQVSYGPSQANGNGGNGAGGLVTADANNVYVVTSNWSCPSDNDNNGGGSGDNGNGCGNLNQGCCSGNSNNSCNTGLTCTDGTCVPGGDAGLLSGVLTGGTTVAAFPLGAGPPSVLATTGDGSPVTEVAVDPTNVYWVTSTSAWMVPIGGGTPTAIAGNLGVPVTPCTSGNTTEASNAASIASDGTNVYIASPLRNAIYKVPVPN